MMNKRSFQRTLAASMTAALLVTSLSGCLGRKKATLEVSLDNSYTSEKLQLEGFNSIQSGYCSGDQMLMFGFDEDYNRKYTLYSLTDGTSHDIELQAMKNPKEHQDYYISSILPMSDGGIGVMIYSYISYDDGSDWVYEDLGTQLEILDSDFNSKEVKQVSQGDDTNYLDIKACCGDSFYATKMDDTGQTQFIQLDSNFKEVKTLDTKLQYVETVVPLKDGSVVICYQDNDYNSQIGKIDPATNELTKLEIEGAPYWANGAFAAQDDAYDYYMYNSDALYGIKLDAGKCDEVVSWVNSDFMGDHVESVVQMNDGHFLLSCSDISYQKSELWKLTPRDPEDMKNVKLISMAALYMPQNLNHSVSTFNRSQNDYRIVIVDYSKYNTDEDYSLGQQKFENDMVSGIVADMIVTDALPYQSLANKGLFLDLTDKADALSDSEYFTNYFDSLKYGDKLYRMGFSYNINTIEAKTDKVGGRSGLSYAEFLDIVKNLPEGTEAFENTNRESALYNSNIYAFVDPNTNTCRFDSDEFVQLLEYCNTFPASDHDDGMVMYDDMWADQQYKYINDEILFRHTYLYDIRNDFQETFQYFDKADVTRVGNPTFVEGSNGGMFYSDFTLAISKNSAYADKCWEFFQSMLSDDYQESLNFNLPVKKSAFDKKAAEAMKPQTYIDNGKEVEYEPTIWRGEEEIKVPKITQEYVDDLKNYISSIKEHRYYDEKINNIISEEATMFFAGDQDAKKTASMIQSRVSLYLSEQG